VHLINHLLPVDDVEASDRHIHVTTLEGEASHQGAKLSNLRILSLESSLSNRLDFGEDNVSFNLPLLNILIDSLCVLVDVLVKLTVERVFYQLLVIHLWNYRRTCLTVSQLQRGLSSHLFVRFERRHLRAHVGRREALTSLHHFRVDWGHDSGHGTLHAKVTVLGEHLLLLHRRSIWTLVRLEVRSASHGV
jgi:hypothetical protein